MKLCLSPDLSLPEDAVTQTFAILAKRGVGKTYCALVLVEELLKARAQVVIADPVGVTWGLRAAANGKALGLPIIVMGGDHGDVPLEASAGKVVAEFVVDTRSSVVLDLSHLRKGDQVRFMTDFAETLYHRNRAPLHLVLDEADAFAPQRPLHGQERMLGAIQDLVRRGRARGIGVTLVTQRAAVLSKDVLTQVEVLVALRTIAPQDREAIDAWIQAHDAHGQRAEFMASLASLPIGTAWFWSPGWLDVFKRVRVRARETFDGSATPKVGAAPAAPKKLAAVDLEALKQQIAATIEKAKTEHPRALRQRIAALEGELAKAKSAPSVSLVKEKRVEVAVLKDGQVKRLEAVAERAIQVAERLAPIMGGFGKESGEILRAIASLRAPRIDERSRPAGVTLPASPSRQAAPARPVARPKTGPVEKTLDALAWWRAAGVNAPDRRQVAFVAGYTVNGHFNNVLGAMRAEELVDYPGGNLVAITQLGALRAGPPLAAPTRDELIRRVRSVLRGAPARRIFDSVVRANVSLSREDLAARAGYTVDGHFNNVLGSLRSLGVVDYPSGNMVALSDLFEGLA